MSFKKRPEKKTFPKQRPYRQSLFSLLFLLSGIYGICLLLLSVPGLRWNRGEVFLLAGLPGIWTGESGVCFCVWGSLPFREDSLPPCITVRGFSGKRRQPLSGWRDLRGQEREM